MRPQSAGQDRRGDATNVGDLGGLGGLTPRLFATATPSGRAAGRWIRRPRIRRLGAPPTAGAATPHPYRLAHEADVFSPALVFYPELIRRHTARVVEPARSPDRLRPHARTHKTREITRLQLDDGVTKHKCATIAEAEMLADAGAP